MTAELTGFSTVVREGVVVVVGQNVDLPLTLKVAAVQETITVTGESPIVDTKATGTATNFTQDELDKVPTSRDPLALMRTVPGVLVDRVNIARQRDRPAVELRVEGHAPAGRGLDDGRRRRSPTWRRPARRRPTSTTTTSRRSRSRPRGQDIKQPTGGVGLNFVVKRGTNQFRGGARGYFTNDALEASNVPDELARAGVTPETADHNEQISDFGFDLGGPIVRDRAWFYGSYSVQDIRLVRRAGDLIDRTMLKNPNVKVNWQATSKDMVNFLFFNGVKDQGRTRARHRGHPVDAPTAHVPPGQLVHRQPAARPVEDRGQPRDGQRACSCPAKYAYYNTGFVLDPMGGIDQQAGRSLLLAQSFGIDQRRA